MNYTSQHFCDKTMDLRGATALVLGGAIAMVLGGAIAPPGFAPADAHDFYVTRVQNCLLEFSIEAHP